MPGNTPVPSIETASIERGGQGEQVRRRGRLGPWYRLAIASLRSVSVVLTRPHLTGLEHVPPAGAVIVAVNHTSVFDPVVVADALLRGTRLLPRFMAKRELLSGEVGPGLLARLLRGAGQIPVDRHAPDAADALRPAVAALREGRCVVLYPEGTITRDPGLWPMAARTGVARLALLTGAPVLPVAQWGAEQVHDPRRGGWSRGVRLWPRRQVHVRIGPPVDLRAWTGRPPTGPVLRDATAAVMDAVTRELEVLRGSTRPARLLDPRRDTLRLVAPERRSA